MKKQTVPLPGFSGTQEKDLEFEELFLVLSDELKIHFGGISATLGLGHCKLVDWISGVGVGGEGTGRGGQKEGSGGTKDSPKANQSVS